MSARPNTSLLAVVGAAVILAWTSGANAQNAPVLVGTWNLNIDKTEPAKDKIIEDAEGTGAGSTMATGMGSKGASRRTGSVAGGGGQRSGGSGGSGGGGGGGGAGRSNFRLIFGGMVNPSKTLKVTQADSVITIEDEDGPLFVNLRADNKTLDETLTNLTVLKTKVQWRKNELVVERSHETDGSARMIIRVDEKNPKLLIVDFHYEHKRQRRTIDQRRIYEAGM